eukprot:gene12687-14896_t
MDKKSFLDLLDRYQVNQCTQEEQLEVEHWFSTLNEGTETELSEENLSEISSRILSRLQQQQTAEKPHTNTIPLRWYKIAVAAVISVIAISVAVQFFRTNRSERSFLNENKGAELISYVNTSKKLLTIALSDHSQVELQPGSTLTYPKVFTGNSRPVYLKGNAFFQVSKNPSRPFYVYNNNLVVRVVGTSFFIKEAGKKATQVDVRTGKVEVKENINRNFLPGLLSKPLSAVLVTPNQKALFEEDQKEIRKTLVDEPVRLQSENSCAKANAYQFEECSMKDILNLLSKDYGIEIKVENTGIYNCTFTGDLNNKGLYDQLNLICQSISGSYKVLGTKILVYGTTCN